MAQGECCGAHVEVRGAVVHAWSKGSAAVEVRGSVEQGECCGAHVEVRCSVVHAWSKGSAAVHMWK